VLGYLAFFSFGSKGFDLLVLGTFLAELCELNVKTLISQLRLFLLFYNIFVKIFMNWLKHLSLNLIFSKFGLRSLVLHFWKVSEFGG